MSASISLASTPFTLAELTDIRRFCGYSLYGNSASGFMGYRFFEVQGFLEYRMLNASPTEIQVVRQYLASLYGLEQAIPAAGQNLDTEKAAVWTHNKNEVADRGALFDGWCKRLCAFFGVPPGPGLGGSMPNRIVV